MGCFHISQKTQYSTAFFILLFVLTSTNARATLFMLQGGSNSKLFENDTDQVSDEKGDDDGKMVIRHRVVVGSRPPTCDWKKYCTTNYCGRCEAVQVPILSTQHQQAASAVATPRSTKTRTDDISNYKPMCWKCKCGKFTFNP